MSDFAERQKIAKQLQPQNWADTLSPDTLRQRKESGAPSRSKVAYFLVDALCHEMAKEFFSDLQKESPKASPVIPPKARSAELPSLNPKRTTEVPARSSNWPLFPAEKDFQRLKKDLHREPVNKQSSRLRLPDTRAKSSDDASIVRPSEDKTDSASGHRVEFLKLKEVCAQTMDSLEQSCLQADLIVVDAKEIGIRAGELNESLELNDERETKVSLVAFGHWIEEVQSAWERLRDLGVQEFVFITGKTGQTVAATETTTVQDAHLQESSAFTVNYQIEAEAKPEMLGYSRLQIRAEAIAETTSPDSKMIHLALRVPERPDIQVAIKDAPGAVMNNLNKHQLAIALNQDWIEVLFDLTGPQDERVKVEVYGPEEETVPILLEASFRAVGSLPDEIDEPEVVPTDTPIPIPVNSSAWQDSFEDENIRAVFIHLQRHGSVTENELTQFLGGARKARSFSLAFEEYLKKVPFSVRIETTAGGKRYVKET